MRTWLAIPAVCSVLALTTSAAVAQGPTPDPAPDAQPQGPAPDPAPGTARAAPTPAPSRPAPQTFVAPTPAATQAPPPTPAPASQVTSGPSPILPASAPARGRATRGHRRAQDRPAARPERSRRTRAKPTSTPMATPAIRPRRVLATSVTQAPDYADVRAAALALLVACAGCLVPAVAVLRRRTD